MNRTNTNLDYPRNSFSLMRRVYRYTLPGVKRALSQWRDRAERIPDAELRTQALASIDTKKFHCQGGSVYACANPAQMDHLLPLIVAFQTISDYLDNLCDRSTSLDPEDFRQLHQAMLDAVTPANPLADYYAFREEKEDGGYLTALVETCRACIGRLPAYPLVEEKIRYLVSLYCDLQVYKHIRKDLREEALTAWWESHKTKYPEIYWNEFAAAAGSTLGVFMLFLAASDSRMQAQEAETILRAYFPYVTGLHILLDYLIDQEEDRIGGDLNFCFYYQSRRETVERIAAIVMEARNAVTRLPSSAFHRMIIEGLLALYLSDPKVREQPEVRHISARLMHKSPLTRLFFLANSIWIRIDFRKKH